ncbi:MAG: SPOR domain-containing protein [Thermodesulfovibrionales bacterium]|nr:SPOR domain-containing protein [Thermodesulfovibrionales bacterium]
MRLKEQGKNSILLLNRSSVIGGAILLVLISLGLGYFIGFKTGHSTVADLEQVVEPPKKIVEEKRVLETPPKKEIQPAPPLPPPSVALDNTDKTVRPEDKKVEKEPPPIEIKKDDTQERSFNKQVGTQKVEKEEIQVTKKTDGKAEEKPQPLPTASEKKSVKNTKQQGKIYTIQFGAFPNIQGAEELQKNLKAKGISAYIVDKGKDGVYYRVRTGSYESKKDADKQVVLLEKKTGLKGFVTTK